ncbi:DUF4435 domain-containing protein [Vibrio parahaemolyticus]|uniref:DUF4435 domain-containing protein n=1 Tax=Vibrio parahaemolyticus TaxID=670 RepID=UPI00112359D7|nr:DUF4435 domain-containing protein [Vibrio parahaemolyticus]TON26502.1 hypothetical protein CGH60_14455 [Vibrio parahaemolyticus]
MSRVEKLKNSTQNYSVKFLEFTRLKAGKKEVLAVFFEGEDEKYYSIRLNNILMTDEWYGFNCGGKNAVLELRTAIRNNTLYKESACMFFVDSDFDDNNHLTQHSDIYITPCYSIENFYVTRSCFERIIKAEFNISSFSDEEECYKKVIATFLKSLKSYASIIKKFNIIIKSQRVLEKDSKTPSTLFLDDIDFDSLVKVGLEECYDLYSNKEISKIFSSLDDDLDLLPGEKYFSNKSDVIFYRGKQNLEFFRKYLNHVKEDRCKRKGRIIFKNKGNVKLNLTKGNVLSELSQYADTPLCLTSFISKYKKQAVI